MLVNSNRIWHTFSAILTFAGLLLSFACQAQYVSNRINSKIIPGITKINLDSNYAVDSKSIYLYNSKTTLPINRFTFNPKNGNLNLDSAYVDTLILTFRILPFLFTRPYYRKSVTIIEPVFKKNAFLYDPLRDGIINTKSTGLKTDGNLSRGINIGNKQDLVVNSSLNLRISGKIADDIRVTGVISDDNNPIQPEGNTQQLQDFDRIYIRLDKDSTALLIGDFEMKQPRSYFMNYNKKSRGVHVELQENKKNTTQYLNADAAISRGRFARNIIIGKEGNQGPYRLYGAQNETFIILISGTEAVYLDGRRLVRGESNDYVINYNSGEVSFMPTKMITRFSRIVVEFQYSDRNYQRSVFKVGAGLIKKGITVEVNYFSEQDNKNQNFQQSLDGYDSINNLSAKQILANVGDETEKAFLPRIRAVKDFDPSKLLYKKIDSLGFKDLFVYSQIPLSDTIFYEVTFSLVGLGKGNYRQKTSTANGRVFEWVMPVLGVPQGDYEPIEQLIAPKRSQMLTFGVKKKFGQTETFLEGVYSNSNSNTFSKIDKLNDDGFGLVFGFKNSLALQKNGKKHIVTNQLRTEIVTKNFNYVERYRLVEFERAWNKQINITQTPKTINLPELIANYDLLFEQKGLYKISYKAGIYRRSNDLNGLSHSLDALLKIKKVTSKASTERMSNSIFSEDGIRKNTFWNYDFDLMRNLKLGKIGLGWHDEQSKFNHNTDSCLLGSFKYNAARLYLESTDSNQLTYGVLAEHRSDKLPVKGVLGAATTAEELSIHGGYRGKGGGRIALKGTLRSLVFLDSFATKGESEKNTLGRIEADIPFFKKAVKFNTYYQVGTGQEQKREFVYFQVADGNGVYIWKDYDSNKVQSLNEFELASEYDRKRANFIKTYLPVQEFIKSKTIQFNQSLALSSPQSWHKKKGLKKGLTRVSALIVYRTDRRTTANDALLNLNPFIFSVNDSQLISSNAALRGSLFINRNNPTWSGDINRTSSQSKVLLVNGFETREQEETVLNTRINFSRKYGSVIQAIHGKRSSFSQLLTTRNYDYVFYSAEPQLQFTSKNNNQGVALIGKYYHANADTLSCQNLEAGLELRFSKIEKGSFSGTFRWVNIKYTGDASNPLGYELLRGLLPGQNYTWTILYQQRLASHIQMDLSYDGRKSQHSSVLHIGRVMVRYLF